MAQVSVDSRLLNQQVLVAALPDSSGEARDPEVHLAWLMPSKNKLCLREATIGGDGDVGFGRSFEIDLKAGTAVQLRERVLRVLDQAGRLLVQMHMESEDDGRRWIEGIELLVGSDSNEGDSAANDDDDGEAADLRKRSAGLAERIRELESVGSRRDKQLNKMVQRLEGAMKMLAAVQDMCAQQRKVIDAQQIAIRELRIDNGVDVHEPSVHEASRGAAREESQTATHVANTDTPNDDVKAAMEAEIAEKTEKMMALLKQADEMQQVLQQLEGAAGMSDGEGNPPSSEEAAGLASIQEMLKALAGMGLDAEQLGLDCKEPEAEDDKDDEEDGDDDDEEVDPAEAQAVLSRLQALEAEKKRFEDMLSTSQQEQQDLLKKLNDMEALKASMGWSADSDSDGD